MPRRKPVPSWVWDVLNEYSPGQIQGGIDIAVPVKVERVTMLPGKEKQWRWDIELTDKRVSGTRIPASTITRMRRSPEGEGWMPGPRTIKKLLSFRNRSNYNRLRAAGATVDYARLYHKRPDVGEIIDQYRRSVLAIARGKQVPPEYILATIQEVDRTPEYWDRYTRARVTPEKPGRPEQPWPVQEFEMPGAGELEDDEVWEDTIDSDEWDDFR